MNTKTQNIIRSISLLLICCFVSLHTASAQDIPEDDYSRNSIYATYGSVIFESQVSISYERALISAGKYKTKAKATYGTYLCNNYDYSTGARVNDRYIAISAVQLLGKLELNVGAAYLTYKSASGFEPDPTVDYSLVKNDLVFYGNIGYRYEADRFLFRAGVGNLELLYIGVGINL